MEAALARGVGERFDFSVVGKSAAVEDDFVDARLFGALGETGIAGQAVSHGASRHRRDAISALREQAGSDELVLDGRRFQFRLGGSNEFFDELFEEGVCLRELLDSRLIFTGEQETGMRFAQVPECVRNGIRRESLAVRKAGEEKEMECQG